jgi:beta-galactosidase
VGGVLVERRDSIQDARLKMLFAGEHYGNFAYHIPMPPGRYRVRLYFAETFFGSKLPYAAGSAGARLFNVFANGEALLRDFDVAKDAGGANRATIKTFGNIEPNAQGNIVLEFVPVRNYAEVNAIEVAQMN